VFIVRPDLDVLADPTRRTLLALLSVERERCVCELEAALELAQPVVSRQLAILRTAEWLDTRREGRRIYYRIGAVPLWARLLIEAFVQGGVPPDQLRAARQRLRDFAGRPIRRTRAAS